MLFSSTPAPFLITGSASFRIAAVESIGIITDTIYDDFLYLTIKIITFSSVHG